MSGKKIIDESKCLDPVFLEYGMEVYTYDYIETLRKEVLELKKKGKRSWNLIPQAGFQEKVLLSEADITICGGARGGGKVQPNETKIVTPFGYRKLGDLEVGSILIDPTTGGFERVIQIFEHPKHDFYEITFDDGSTCECGLEHLWKVRINEGQWVVLDFAKIIDAMTWAYMIEIPITRQVECFETSRNAREIELDAFIRKYISSQNDDSITLRVYNECDAKRIRILILSLGGKAFFSSVGNDNWIFYYKHQHDLTRRIVSYRYVGKKDGRCITVDSPGALYMCNDFIVTHNTAVALIGAMPYADNPEIRMYGFRRYEADVERGIFSSAKQIFRGFATFAKSGYEVNFFNGNGAVMKMEHLADLSKVKDRFRGAEMPYIVIEELAEFTKENMNVIFDLIGSNRSTTGLPSRFICTCNPVGRSNKLRWFLDWWIDPETDEAIPSRSGKLRYFCRYGEDIMEIAWGNTPEEVFENPNARRKIEQLTDKPKKEYKNFITSVTFIDGAYGDNKILHATDTKYMNRISSGGNKSVINDIKGVWRDVGDSSCLITADDMQRFFTNTSQTNGIRCGGGDIAFKNDWLVLWALDGMHIIDVEARQGVTTETLPDILRNFCQRNEIPYENFAFDGDGVGVVLKQTEDAGLQKCHAFSNRGPANDKVGYRNRKSECAGLLINAFHTGTISIDESIARRMFTDKKMPFSVMDKLMEERIVLRWIEDENPRELIKKPSMKDLIGHSPDWIEGLIYAIDRVDNAKRKAKIRKGNWSYFC